MTWTIVQLDKPTYTADELGNPVQTGAERVLTSRCRVSPWTAQEVSVYGSDFTTANRRYAIPHPYLSGIGKDFRGTDYTATIDGVEYDVTNITEYFPRWLVLTVKAVRP